MRILLAASMIPLPAAADIGGQSFFSETLIKS
jgi:hypothetical protein